MTRAIIAKVEVILTIINKYMELYWHKYYRYKEGIQRGNV